MRVCETLCLRINCLPSKVKHQNALIKSYLLLVLLNKTVISRTAHIPRTVIPCSLHNIVAVVIIIAKHQYQIDVTEKRNALL